jgi:hypothetical protein
LLLVPTIFTNFPFVTSCSFCFNELSSCIYVYHINMASLIYGGK